MSAPASVTTGFIILTAGLVIIGTTMIMFFHTNGRAVRTATYGYRTGEFISALGIGWLLGATAAIVSVAVGVAWRLIATNLIIPNLPR